MKIDNEVIISYLSDELNKEDKADFDLELLDNRTIKFPNNVDNEIIKKTIELLSRKDFENYKIIDLRIDGKIIVE